jgi:hypothetical protein
MELSIIAVENMIFFAESQEILTVHTVTDFSFQKLHNWRSVGLQEMFSSPGSDQTLYEPFACFELRLDVSITVPIVV